jgi:hypothetical protein
MRADMRIFHTLRAIMKRSKLQISIPPTVFHSSKSSNPDIPECHIESFFPVHGLPFQRLPICLNRYHLLLRLGGRERQSSQVEILAVVVAPVCV